MNNWNATGTLGKDAEIRYMPNGDAVAGFSLAVRYGYGKNENTVWANCSLFGKRAESLAPYLLKGAKVAICGEINLRKYEAKDGQEKQSLDVRIIDLELLVSKQDQRTDLNDSPAAKPAQNKGFDDLETIPF